MTNEEQLKLVKMLFEIEANPEKVLVHESFFANQWIQYNPQKDCFEYEDHAFLGDSSGDVIDFLQSLLPELVMPFKWHIEQKKNLDIYEFRGFCITETLLSFFEDFEGDL